MILRAYVMKASGDALLGRSYEDKESAKRAEKLPPHVRSCLTLFHTGRSTELENAYTLEQGDLVWRYVFFESFAVIFLSTLDDSHAELERRMISIGKSVAQSYGRVIETWNGDMDDIEEMGDLIDRFVLMDMALPGKRTMTRIEKLVNKTLENSEVSYVGIFDAQGTMISGNVPDTHITQIQTLLEGGTVRHTVEMVPTELKLRQHRLHMLTVQSLTVVVGTFRADSRVRAIGIVADVAQTLTDIISK